MWLVLIIFVALTLWFFPLTAAITYNGRWRVFWLPRVWCGFASPHRLSLLRDKSRSGSLRRLPMRFWFIFGRRLLPYLSPCRFRFRLGPASARFYCIAGVTVGHIILSTAGAALLYAKRRKWDRRIIWPLKGRSKN